MVATVGLRRWACGVAAVGMWGCGGGRVGLQRWARRVAAVGAWVAAVEGGRFGGGRVGWRR